MSLVTLYSEPASVHLAASLLSQELLKMVAETGTSIGQVSQTWAIRPISNSQSFHAIKDIMRSPSPPVDGTIRLGRKFNSHSISRRVSSPKPFKSKKCEYVHSLS